MKRALLYGFSIFAFAASASVVFGQQSTEPKAWNQVAPVRDIGPSNMSGRIVALRVIEDHPTHFYVATASGGILKTQNNGTTFEHIFDDQEVVSIGDIAICQSNPDILWVGSGENNPRNSVSYGNGVYKSVDGGKTFEHKGLKNSFQIGAIEVHPENPDIVYVGALGRLYGSNEERGLYKTTDGGETWEKIHYIDEKTGVIEIEVHPEDPDTFLFATYDRERDMFDTNDPSRRFGPGTGLFITQDGGKTIEPIKDGLPNCNLGRIALNYYRKDPNIVYALVESELIGKLSENVGYLGIQGQDAETGAKITGVTKESPAAEAGMQEGDIILEVGNENVLSYNQLLAAVRNAKPGDEVTVEFVRNRVLETATVTIGSTPKPDESEEDQPRGRRRSSDPYGTYLGGQVANIQDQQGPEGNNYGGVYRSEDGGRSWTRVNSLNPRPMYFSHIQVDPNNDQNIYVCGVSFHQSKDGGKTFTSDAGRGVHSDLHALWINPNDSDHLVLGSDGGVYISYDQCKNWDHLNHVALGQFYHVGVGPELNYRIYGGLQDNGSWGGPSRTKTGSGPINQDWIRIGGGDGFLCLVDPNDKDQIYYESQNGGMGRTNLRTGERGSIRPRTQRGEPRPRFNWRTPFALSNFNSRIYYCAGSQVFRSLDRGNNLRAISENITRTDRGSATAFSESHKDPDVLYVGTDDGAFWMTKNGGNEWIDLIGWGEEEEAIATEPAPEAEAQSESNAEAELVSLSSTQDQESTEESKEDKAAQAAVNGTWKGEVMSDEAPPGEGGFTMTLSWTDGTLSGAVESQMGESEIVSGKFNPESQKLAFVTSSDFGDADWNVTLDGNKMTGVLSAMGGQFTMDFKATREAETKTEEVQEEQAPLEEAVDDSEGLPLIDLISRPMYVSSLEASRHQKGRVYVAFDGHRSDVDAPHAYVSENNGETWKSLNDNLPWGSTRVLREDLKNPNLLYCGTEFGLSISVDRGETWAPLKSGFPTVAVHEIAQPTSMDEIVIATHGRSLWIADVTLLRQLDAEMMAKDVALLKPNDVIRWRREPSRGSEGVRTYTGKNPPQVAHMAYHLGKDARRVSFSVRALSGETLAEFGASNEAGIHYVSWNLRSGQDGSATQGRRRQAPSASAGTYVAVLEVDGQTFEERFEIMSDPESPGYGRAFEEGYADIDD